MNANDESAPTFVSVHLRWIVADMGFWIADQGGAFAGSIDRRGAHHFVKKGTDEHVGDYETLDAAQAALAARILKEAGKDDDTGPPSTS